jgi:hypothetical protein
MALSLGIPTDVRMRCPRASTRCSNATVSTEAVGYEGSRQQQAHPRQWIHDRHPLLTAGNARQAGIYWFLTDGQVFPEFSDPRLDLTASPMT